MVINSYHYDFQLRANHELRSGFGDAEEEGLLRDFTAYRLPECLVPTLDGFCEKFMNLGLAQSVA